MQQDSIMVIQKNTDSTTNMVDLIDDQKADNDADPDNEKDDDNIEIEVMEFNKSADVDDILKSDDNSNNALIKYLDSGSVVKPAKWSKSDETSVKRYVKMALGYKILYHRTYIMYDKYYKFITWPLILFTCCSLALQTIFATLISTCSGQPNDNMFSIITTCVSVCVSILTYLQAKTSYDSSAKDCRKAASAFSEFADDLNTLLSFPRKNRANPHIVITMIHGDYKKLIKTYSEYPIPESIYKQFAKQNKNDGIIFDIIDNTNVDNFDLYNGNIEKNLVIDKFIESLKQQKQKTYDKSSSTYKNNDVRIV